MVTSNSLKLTLCAAFAAASLMAPASIFAGTDTSDKETKSVVQPTEPSAITGDLGVNFVSQYLTRGFVQENQGAIGQPYLDLYFAVYTAKDTDFINKVTLNLGLWSSIQDKKTGATAGNTVKDWYEFDYCPGVSVTFLKNFTLTTSYFEFDSPNGGFGNPSRNFNLNLAYNDADVLGAFALHPHVTYLRELSGKVGNLVETANKGDYFEVGIAPGLPAYGPVTVTLPITAGFGAQNFYYENQGFGYFSVGPNVAVALSCIPAKLGVWTANFGATYYYLDGALQPQLATGSDGLPVVNNITNGNHNDFVFNGGIGVTF
jgi:hypothetical protein